MKISIGEIIHHEVDIKGKIYESDDTIIDGQRYYLFGRSVPPRELELDLRAGLYKLVDVLVCQHPDYDDRLILWHKKGG